MRESVKRYLRRVLEASPEFFAGAFLSIVETGMREIDVPDEYLSDPRVPRIVSALRSVGVSRAAIVGAGSFGVAAETPGRIAKLTSDETEVRAGSVLRGQKLAHVAHVYGAWFVTDTTINRWDSVEPERVGLLLQEKLTPVDHDDTAGEKINDIWRHIRSSFNAFPHVLASVSRHEARRTLHESSVEMTRMSWRSATVSAGRAKRPG